MPTEEKQIETLFTKTCHVMPNEKELLVVPWFFYELFKGNNLNIKNVFETIF